MTSQATNIVYDFSQENKWRGVLQPALGKIQKQVHPRMDIEDDAILYMEDLLYHLLALICSTKPHSIGDVAAYIAKTFVVPINTWAISDAQKAMERHHLRKGKSVFNFPVDKLHTLLEKEVFKGPVEVNMVRYIAAILDYIAADILKLAGNFMKNTQKVAICIRISDIKLSLSADVALHSLFQQLNAQHLGEGTLPPVEASEESEQAATYDQLVRQLVSNEEKYISHLNLILKVFQEPFTKRPDLFPPEEVKKFFLHLPELCSVSVKLLASLDDCMEMAGVVGGGAQSPQAGFVFEEMAESQEFDVYINYASTFKEAESVLEGFLENSEAVEYLKTLTEPDLFKEAIQYVLPKSLLEPLYHCFYYFEAMNMLMKKSKGGDHDAYGIARGCMVTLRTDLEKQCTGLLPSRKEELGTLVEKPSYKTLMKIISNVQSKIEGWEGPDLLQCSTEFIMEGSIVITREGNRRRIDRHVFLLDGLAVCCKPRQGNHEMYRFKEKINLRRVKLVDLQDDDESTDMKYSLLLNEPDQLPYTFYFQNKSEKIEWMSALTHMLTRSTFDRKLDIKLRDEEQDIPQLRPHPDYRFAEDDHGSNILFDEQEEGKFKSSNEALIKACTIHKLIERLTYHEYADPTLVRTFLMTYRSFCSPTKLLDLLIERFHIPLSDEAVDSETKEDPLMMKAVKVFKANYVSPIQLRVVNVLRHWVDYHYYDFQGDQELLVRLQNFISSVKGKKMQKWVAALNRALDKRRDETPHATKPVFSKKPLPVEWWQTQKPEEFNILSLHPKEIARQLTLIMADNFRAIHPSELVDASWMKEKKKEAASPNLLKHTRFETMVSNWLTKEVVYTENFEERVALVGRLVDIMAEMKNLNNFAGMFAVNAAFQSSSIFRLTHTLKKLEGRKSQLLDEVKLIASPDRAYKNYKEKLRNINPPCVPFVGMYLSWIVFIRDGNEDQIPGMPDNFINFRKRRKLATVLQEIQQYQHTPYCIEPEPSIQKFLINQDPQGDATHLQWEESLFQQSHIIEPKDQPPTRAPRRWKIDLRGPDQGSFLTLPGRRQHRPKVSQLSIDDDADPDSHKNSGGSEPTSPSPTSQPLLPPIPPKPGTPKDSSLHTKSGTPDESAPDIPPRSAPKLAPKPAPKLAPKPVPRSPPRSVPRSPPRSPTGSPPILPPRPRTKDRVSLQSTSWVGSLETPPTPPHHEPPSFDSGGTPTCSQPAPKKPMPLPPDDSSALHHHVLSENGTHYHYKASPVSSPISTSTPSPDMSPTALHSSYDCKSQLEQAARGFRKPPAPPPSNLSSQIFTGDYPPYDKLAPVQKGEYPAYDRLTPISILPLPNNPQPDAAPPLPPRSATESTRPSLPPKPTQISSVPPIPPREPNN